MGLAPNVSYKKSGKWSKVGNLKTQKGGSYLLKGDTECIFNEVLGKQTPLQTFYTQI